MREENVLRSPSLVLALSQLVLQFDARIARNGERFDNWRLTYHRRFVYSLFFLFSPGSFGRRVRASDVISVHRFGCVVRARIG